MGWGGTGGGGVPGGMPGRMGGDRVTLKNVEVIDVKTEQNLLLLKGGVPGSKGSLLFIVKGGR